MQLSPLRVWLACCAVAHLPVLSALVLGSEPSKHAAALQESLVAAIQSLKAAVENGDVMHVEAVSKQLADEARRRSKPERLPTGSNHTAPLTAGGLSGDFSLRKQNVVQEQEHSVKKDGCVFDDILFSISPEDKYELWTQLQDPTMQEAVTWVKSGGWWFCANYGEACACEGNVRMVNVDRTTEFPTKVATAAPSFSAYCDVSEFGGTDITPGVSKVCECESLHQPFHLHKRLTSVSLLQEAWIFLLRLTARAKLLPLGTGDRTYHGIENWAQRHVPGTTPMVIERVWIEMFVKQVVAPATTASRCLEWGNPATPGAGFNYANMVPTCTYKMDVQYDAVHYGQKPMSMEGNIVYTDIDNMPSVLQSQGDQRVDLVFATQVFEHLHNPHVAVAKLFESLLPGGLLVYTAPQQAQFHLVPHDFFRYTKEGVLYLLQTAGFCVPAWGFAGGGDFVFDIARDAGLQVQDFPVEELEGGFQRGYDAVSDSAITIHALGYKPPHEACNSAMAGLHLPR